MPMTQIDWLRLLLSLEDEERQIFQAALLEKERDELRFHWKLWARAEQLPPQGEWQTWLIGAGRGFGKTRAGAKWLRHIAKRNKDARIAHRWAAYPRQDKRTDNLLLKWLAESS
jgi:hypothetical protein